jgi:hypothetical protein
LGWGTTAAYGVACLASIAAWRRLRVAGASRTLRWAWLSLGVLMAALCVNKQLDLQQLIEVVGRRVALEHGWYDARRDVQAAFIKGLMLATVVGVVAAAWSLRGERRRLWLAGLGVALVAAYAVVRAAFFHHVDVLRAASVGASDFSCVLELAGVACVIVAARSAAAAPPGDQGA